MAKSRKSPVIPKKTRSKRSSKKKLVKQKPPVQPDREGTWCTNCGAEHEVIRPGKTQPTCICDLICDACGGRIAYFAAGEDSRYPTASGFWCSKCGSCGVIE